MSKFSEADIVPLDPIAHIRRRPGMYIGGTDQHALHYLVFEVVSDSVADAVEQTCDKIEVILHPHSSVTVSDNGKGIPLHIHKQSSLPFLQAAMTVVGQVNRWYKGGYNSLSSAFGFGVGMPVVNALSTELIAQVRRDGYLWQQSYREGKPTSEIVQVRPLDAGESTGTTITFTPDFTVFQPNEFSYTTLVNRLRELAFLVPGLNITLKDEREQPEGEEVNFHYPNGLADFVAYLNRNHTPIHLVIHRREVVVAKRNDEKSVTVDVEIAFQFVEQAQTLVLGYGNTVETDVGGTHVDGLLEGIEMVFNRFFYDQGLVKFDEMGLLIHELTSGLTAVVSILHPHLYYAGALRREIANPEVRDVVYNVTINAVNEFSEQHPAEMQRLVDYLLARKQERDQRRFGV